MGDRDQFNASLVDSLERSLDQLDDETLAILAERRQQVLTPKRRFVQPTWVAAAAAVVVAIAMPFIYYSKSGTPQPNTDLAYYSVDPEMLEVMDMLIAVGDLVDPGEDPDAI